MCVFFFFKQKTAYEMRISDWSSDVCSSDLEIHELIDGGIGGREAAAHHFLADEILVPRRKGGDVEADMIAGKADAALEAFAAFGAEEIGRASCRERVWRSV